MVAIELATCTASQAGARMLLMKRLRLRLREAEGAAPALGAEQLLFDARLAPAKVLFVILQIFARAILLNKNTAQ